MGNELEKKENRAGFVVSFYYLDAMKHYVEHQNHYHQMIPEKQRPASVNTLPLFMLQHIIGHLSEEEAEYEEILKYTIESAKKRCKTVSMVGIFHCSTCGEKGIIPVEVKTSRDDMEYIINGRFNYEKYMEYKKTEEIVNVNLHLPDNFASGCTCQEKKESDYIARNTIFGIELSEKDLKDLKEIIEKENAKTKKNGE